MTTPLFAHIESKRLPARVISLAVWKAAHLQGGLQHLLTIALVCFWLTAGGCLSVGAQLAITAADLLVPQIQKVATPADLEKEREKNAEKH